MRKRDLTIIGQTSSEGKFYITNKQEMTDFFKQWPNASFTMCVSVESTKDISRVLLAYYYKKIIPDMQRIFWDRGEKLSKEQTDKRVIELAPIARKEIFDTDTGKWEIDYISPNKMDNQQMVFFIEQLKEIAAVEYHYFIDDPKDI